MNRLRNVKINVFVIISQYIAILDFHTHQECVIKKYDLIK